jgi:hypothetical protein
MLVCLYSVFLLLLSISVHTALHTLLVYRFFRNYITIHFCGSRAQKCCVYCLLPIALKVQFPATKGRNLVASFRTQWPLWSLPRTWEMTSVMRWILVACDLIKALVYVEGLSSTQCKMFTFEWTLPKEELYRLRFYRESTDVWMYERQSKARLSVLIKWRVFIKVPTLTQGTPLRIILHVTVCSALQ